MVSFMKLNPQDHRALELGLITLHETRLGPKKGHKVGPDWGLRRHELGRCLGQPRQPQAMYKATLNYWGHSQLGYYFWDKGLIKDYVAVDLGVYHDLLLFDQQILNK